MGRAVPRRLERGQATLWMLVVVVLVVVTTASLIRWGSAVVESGRLDAVADLVALAGVTGGRGASLDVAERNGARLVRFETTGDQVRVGVTRRGLHSAASAEPDR